MEQPFPILRKTMRRKQIRGLDSSCMQIATERPASGVGEGEGGEQWECKRRYESLQTAATCLIG